MTFLNVFRKVGGAFDIYEDGIRFWHPGGAAQARRRRDRRAPRLHDRLAAAAHRRADPGARRRRSCTRPSTRTASASPTRCMKMGADIRVHPRGLDGAEPPRARAATSSRPPSSPARRRCTAPTSRCPTCAAASRHLIAALTAEGESTVQQRRHHQPRLRELRRQAGGARRATSTSMAERATARRAPALAAWRARRGEASGEAPAVGVLAARRRSSLPLMRAGRDDPRPRRREAARDRAVRPRAQPLHRISTRSSSAVAVWRHRPRAAVPGQGVAVQRARARRRCCARRGRSRSSAAAAAARRDPLEAGEAPRRARASGVIVYPEGSLTRDPDLWPMRGKTGAVRLALQLGHPGDPGGALGRAGLMPLTTTAASGSFPQAADRRHVRRPRRPLRPRGRPPTGPTLRAATDRIMAAITALLEELRGETGARRALGPGEARPDGDRPL